MNIRHAAATTAILSAVLLAPTTADAKIYGDTIHVTEHATVLTGNDDDAGRRNILELYSREGLAFSDPAAPRFLFLDREGKVALGIGGFVKAIGMYDFDGAINSPGFSTYNIPVPANPALRQRFGADASHSTLFLKLLARNSRLGLITAYVQTEFTGDNGGYGLKLTQAYLTIGHVTAGLANSTFTDPESQAPTIDPKGPAGQISAKNMLFRYTFGAYKGLSGGVSIEVPQASYTTVDGQSEAIAQRSPDVPAYIQYSWSPGCHVRLAGIMRQLSYRDLVDGKNRWATGWGVTLSSVGDIVGSLGYFGHIAYGKGIASYVNDISGLGYDLIPSSHEGKLHAPGTLAWTAGLSYHFTRRFFVAADVSVSRVYDNDILGKDSYLWGRYVALNSFYDLTGDLRFGIEYLHGRRCDVSGIEDHANRFEAMLQYSF